MQYKATGIKSPEANPDAKRLYDDLLSNYNRLIRPVVNNSETLTVWLGLKLSQLMEVNLKNQVMTTNLWVPQVNYWLFFSENNLINDKKKKKTKIKIVVYANRNGMTIS